MKKLSPLKQLSVLLLFVRFWLLSPFTLLFFIISNITTLIIITCFAIFWIVKFLKRTTKISKNLQTYEWYKNKNNLSELQPLLLLWQGINVVLNTNFNLNNSILLIAYSLIIANLISFGLIIFGVFTCLVFWFKFTVKYIFNRVKHLTKLGVKNLIKFLYFNFRLIKTKIYYPWLKSMFVIFLKFG
ncbi:hypothetical protein P344_06570 [Spiroplasma mirum ATCC 29335]|uniref:Uncharacterized protein n=1 Tax=Spiroplasma mirum ATCC 29335 TaxID=838561 RepID=W0GMS1_9MOLU|nr:hypothetical protein SMM_1103 [Spiroplasma mirum ATCC 29335]AHI58615.1 hypothetical protein P344_06570 [Spiroplasma mirum ATCC 29335]AKM53514.1 hypothetical protein SATRI_v1c11730 [Spiroplasma atrichopogonis]